MSVGAEHLLGHRLVHRQRRAEHPGAGVRDVAELEQTLHRAVLAHRAVEQRQHDGDAPSSSAPSTARGAAAMMSDAETDGPAVSRRSGSAPGPAARAICAASPSAHSPLGRDADRRHPVAGRCRSPRSTWDAVTQLTSCSADWPPYSTTRWIRLTGPTVPPGACETWRFARGARPRSTAVPGTVRRVRCSA